MIIKLNGETKSSTGRPFKKKEVKEMVKAYRKVCDPKKDLKYAHLTVKEVLTLLVENGIIPKDVLNQVKTPDKGKEYGLKIYIGQHASENTCPSNRVADYLHSKTTILCNTKVIAFKAYLDMLDDTKSVAIPLAADPGDAIDQATICPPDCADDFEPDPTDGYDIGQD
jgi:hypothetical protein